MNKPISIALFLSLVVLTGCSSLLPTPSLILEPTTTQTPLPTPTINWFPATPTFTPMPTETLEPTTDPRPGVGDVLVLDTFLDATLWRTVTLTASSAVVSNQSLTIAINQPQGYQFSLRKQPILQSFYMEMTVTPNLCQGADSFGLLLRAANEFTYDRYAINCNGQLKFERVNTEATSVLQDWVSSGQLHPGAAQQMRLGLWVSGSTIRGFVNGIFQFEVSETIFHEGTLGVFARSAGKTPVSVTFSDLQVNQLTRP